MFTWGKPYLERIMIRLWDKEEIQGIVVQSVISIG